ncbi:heme-dependent oxidative N-demethylase subunit alpha family protein [Peredibacter sp. HCB2-198]|uniref:heme-dependent oxidative N-demethylase subunit alpha family protein n=1 Tax=Peredibacter sp. HCB2-198 TaxID=3383025 RepID=UPI0038B4A50A
MNDRPWQNGKFIITAGLKPLEAKPIFLPEPELSHYIKNKIKARSEGIDKHYPDSVGLTSTELEIIANKLRALIPQTVYEGTFKDEIDFLISQVPEDFSVWKMEDGKEWLALIHLMSPNHWDAHQKIGKSFFDSHAPIPHIDAISKAAPKMFEQIQKRGAMERFAWGVATDNRLNHHPVPPVGISVEEWQGRSFDPESPKLFIRMERQTLFPISEKLIGFTIKTSFTDVSILPGEDLKLIIQCIESMDEAILKYKGLIRDKKNILQWLFTLTQERHISCTS